MANDKNREQARVLKFHLKNKHKLLREKLKKLKNKMKRQGFSVEIYREINIVEYKIMVCKNRMEGTIDDPRNEFELPTPKQASY